MHPTAINNCKKFIAKYLKGKGLRVLDVGSWDVNGSLRPLFEKQHEYVGCDIRIKPGKNVDVQVSETSLKPIEDNSFDVVVSSSTLEHVRQFWTIFSEMIRVTKNGGLIYICAPSGGHRHGKVDCWRFYKDCWAALASWDPRAMLLESYVDKGTPWCDSVGIYKVVKL